MSEYLQEGLLGRKASATSITHDILAACGGAAQSGSCACCADLCSMCGLPPRCALLLVICPCVFPLYTSTICLLLPNFLSYLLAILGELVHLLLLIYDTWKFHDSMNVFLTRGLKTLL